MNIKSQCVSSYTPLELTAETFSRCYVYFKGNSQ